MLPDSIVITITTGLYKVNAARCGVRGARSGLRVACCELGAENLTNLKSATPNPQSKNLVFNLLAVIIDSPYIYHL